MLKESLQAVEINSNPKNNRHSNDFKRSFNGKHVRNNRLLKEAIAAHSFHSGRELQEQINYDEIKRIIAEMLGKDPNSDKDPNLIEDSKPRDDGREVLTDAKRGVKKPSLNDFMNRRKKQKRQLLNDQKDRNERNNKKRKKKLLIG